MKTTYVGLRVDGVATVYVARGKRLDPLPMRLDLRNHSPDGPEWGYGGSGPAQLALAILAHATGNDHVATILYQHYKWQKIAQLPRGNWRLPQQMVLNWIAGHDKTELDRCAFLNAVEAPWQQLDQVNGADLMEDYYGQETHPDFE